MGSSRIRLYSRLAALALAALAGTAFVLLRVQRAEDHFNTLTITSYIVVEQEPHHEAPARRPPPEQITRAVAAAAYIGPPVSDPPARLWSYDSQGRIVFDHLEQYNRCLAARAEHHNEADCPEPHDPHPLALRPG
jgi:hypothetical protein